MFYVGQLVRVKNLKDKFGTDSYRFGTLASGQKICMEVGDICRIIKMDCPPGHKNGIVWVNEVNDKYVHFYPRKEGASMYASCFEPYEQDFSRIPDDKLQEAIISEIGLPCNLKKSHG